MNTRLLKFSIGVATFLIATFLAAPALASQYQVTSTIPVGTLPQATAVSPDGQTLAVANAIGHSISLIDTATNTVQTTIALANDPISVAYTPDGTSLYVSFGSVPGVAVINTSNNTVSSLSISPTCNPKDVTINSSSSLLYLGCSYHAYILKVGIPGGSTSTFYSPGGTNYFSQTTLSPDNTNLYAVSPGSPNKLYKIQTSNSSLLGSLTLTYSPTDILVNPTGTRVFVSDSSNSKIEIVDTSTMTVVSTINLPSGSGAQSLALTPDGQSLLVAANQIDSVLVYDTTSLLLSTTVSVGPMPIAVSISPNGNFAYAANMGDNTVSVIDLRAVTPTPAPTPDPTLANTASTPFDFSTPFWVASSAFAYGLLALRRRMRQEQLTSQ